LSGNWITKLSPKPACSIALYGSPLNVLSAREEHMLDGLAKRLRASELSSLRALLLLHKRLSLSPNAKSAARNNSLTLCIVVFVCQQPASYHQHTHKLCRCASQRKIKSCVPKVARGMQTSGKTRGATQIQIKFAPASN